jgi:hypothetical protein
MGRACMCCCQCLNWASGMWLANPPARVVSKWQHTICSVPGQVCTYRCGKKTQSPDEDLDSLKAITGVHYVPR